MRNSRRANVWDTKVRPRLKEIEDWARFDTDSVIAEKLGISRAKFSTLKKEKQELRDALKKGREKVAIQMRKNLFLLATGYEEKEELKKIIEDDGSGKTTIKVVKTKTVAPLLKAIEMLLSNYDHAFHPNVDYFALKKEALKIQKEKTIKQVEEWEEV